MLHDFLDCTGFVRTRRILLGWASLPGISGFQVDGRGPLVMVASLLPFWVVLGHNILYVAIGFVWLSLGDDGAAEEAVIVRQGHGGYGYQVAALVCFVGFADSLLRRMEGQQERMFLWVGWGRWETIVVFGTLSVILQLLFWSKIVDPGNHRTRGA
jgi:hypothetical protein